ncbi:MAG: CHAT domain-containing protein [Candidatus Aminicenantes bacterium]|nr:CHAT domain-containing protein [Candidatus Aminicenantes bacterium]
MPSIRSSFSRSFRGFPAFAGILLALLAAYPPKSRSEIPVQTQAQTKNPSPIKQAQEKFRAGDFDGALGLYARLAAAARTSGDRRGEMTALSGMGQCYSRQYESAKAAEAYRAALALARAIPDPAAEFDMTLAAGSAVGWTGDTETALGFLNAALAQARKANDGEKLESVLNALGVAHYQAGHFESALVYYRQAVDAGRALGDRGHEGFVLVNMGEVYRRIHELEKARRAYEEAVAFARRTKNATLEWAGIRSLGTAAYENGQMGEARRAYNRALELCQELKTRDGQAGTHVAMGKLELAEKRMEQARSHFETARVIYEESGSNLVMHPLNYLGDIHFLEGRIDQALASYRKSLDLAVKMDVFNYLIEMNFKIGRALEKSGDDLTALAHYVRSTENIESIRARVGGESLRTGFLKGYVEVYERLIGLLLRLHRRDPSSSYDRQAFAAAEKSKARAFLDGLEEARIDLLAAMDPGLRTEKLRVSRFITQSMTALQRSGLSEEVRASHLSALTRAEEDYERLIEKIRSGNPGLAEIQAGKTPDLGLVREKLLDGRTALVEFFVGQESAFAFLATRDGFWAEDLGGSGELDRAVENFLLFLRTASGEDILPASRGLAAKLFPFVRRIPASVDRLIVVPDGSLYRLPFEALALDRDGKGERLLVETLALSTAPSAASLIALEARSSPEKAAYDLGGFGSPSYKGEDGGKAGSAERDSLRESYFERGFELSPLPFSAREIRGSARYFKSGRTRIFLGDRASETAFKRARLSDFGILHLAVHGLIDEQNAARSALVFSPESEPGEDGFLTAREVYELEIPSELVVLSACSTARGKIERGEGVSGLGRAFLYAGAQTVLASLWSVRDRSTAEFMPRFYKHLTAGRTKEEALRLAKLDSLRAGSPPAGWAAFILIGEGRERPKAR